MVAAQNNLITRENWQALCAEDKKQLIAELSAVATAAGMTNGGWDEEIALDATVSYLREVMLPRERVERVQGRRDAVEDAVAVAAARVRVEQGNVVG